MMIFLFAMHVDKTCHKGGQIEKWMLSEQKGSIFKICLIDPQKKWIGVNKFQNGCFLRRKDPL